MFTGIIQELGTIHQIIKTPEINKVVVLCNQVLNEVKIGDSIAVNGVCLTVVKHSADRFEADVSSETWQRTNLTALKTNSVVNLESALSVGSKMGGHFVQGHIDGLGTLEKSKKLGSFYNLTCSLDTQLLKFLVEKGSIALNGISLTITNLTKNSFSCAIVPHTWQETNLHLLKSKDFINIEIDILAKYVYRFLSFEKTSEIDNIKDTAADYLDKKFLEEHGFL